MKKSLKVLASATLAFSMFASVAMADTTTTSTTSAATTAAAAKTSADFKDLAGIDAGLKAQIDAMLAKGVFEGVSEDSFGIAQNMTRAQFAKVLTLVFGVKVDTTVKTSSFSDVKADDAANSWAIPYIEAAKNAKLIDGMTADMFAPGDNVTLGQLATALVKGVGKTVDTTGTPWYADAVKQAVELKIFPEGTDGSKVATRGDLVVGAFGGQAAYAEANKPAAVSVKEVKATGVKTVVVTFDRDVDTAKATLSLKKGTISVATTAKFADDKKSATLTLTDTTLRAGDYTVTLGGLDASAIKTATGTFTAQDETVQKIEFVTAGDTVAKSDYASVILKATNQYGENASFSAGSYQYQIGNSDVGNTKIERTADGLLKLHIDTDEAGLQSSISIIPVSVWFNDTRVSVTKNFVLGTSPFITKMDLGEVKYSNGSSISQPGETATFELNAYDQYGNKLSFDAVEAIVDPLAPTLTELNTKVQTIFTPYESNLTYSVQDFDNDNSIKVRVSFVTNSNVDKSGEFTAQVYLQGAAASAKISVNSSKTANKVEIGDINNVIAAGDTGVWIPIVAYDAQGNQLSTNDLVSAQNVGRIKVTVSGATVENEGGLSAGGNATIWATGDNKGSIKLNNITSAPKGVVSVTAYIAEANAQSTATKTYTVANVRVPDHLKMATEPAKNLVAGSKSLFKLQVIDQYGKSMDKSYAVDSNGNLIRTTPANAVADYNNNTHYVVTFSQNSFDAAKVTVGRDDNATSLMPPVNDAAVAPYQFNIDGTNVAVANDSFGAMNDDFNIYTATNATIGNSYSFTAELRKVTGGGYDALTNAGVLVDSLTRNFTVTSALANTNLTYSLNAVPALWNAIDSGLIESSTYDGVNTLSVAEQENPVLSFFHREVVVSAKNAAGETVAIPKTVVSVTSSNPSVVKVGYDSAAKKAWVLGNNAGTATVGVSFIAADGTLKTLTTDVTVKNDAFAVTNVAWGDSSKKRAIGTSVFENLKVTDSYGRVYENGTAQKYNYLNGISFEAKNISAGGSVTINQYGIITAGAAGTKFDLVAYSASGKTATQAVTLDAAVPTVTYAPGANPGEVATNMAVGQEYRIDGGAWTDATNNLVLLASEIGDVIEVRVKAAGSVAASGIASYTLTAADIKGPNAPAVTFSAGTNPGEVDTNMAVGQEYRINGGAWTDATLSAVLTARAIGDVIEVRVKATVTAPAGAVLTTTLTGSQIKGPNAPTVTFTAAGASGQTQTDFIVGQEYRINSGPWIDALGNDLLSGRVAGDTIEVRVKATATMPAGAITTHALLIAEITP